MLVKFARRKTTQNLITLFLFYINVVICFAIIYWIFDLSGFGIVVDHYSSVHQNNWLDSLLRSLYLSAVTLLSVGYGDLTPFGLSRGVAVFEAMIGYILPAALVIQFVSKNKQQ